MARAKSEYQVESLFIDRLIEMGYDYVELGNYDDVLENFRTQLCEVNKDKLIAAKGEASLSDAEFDRVILRLENHSVYESAKILREQWVLELDNGESVYLDFLTDDETRNTYQVAHQITMDKEHKDDVLYKNRYDVTILINGLPLVQVELKRPGIEINEAINQINRYRRFSFRGLFRYIQIFVVSNSTQTKYFANANENCADNRTPQNILKSLVFYWTDSKNVRINRLIDFTNDFLPKFHLTEMLTKYFVIKQTEPILMVMRPYQVCAVRDAYSRVIGSNKGGYCFHATGSGKTLTSFKLASLLRDNPNIDRVFFLIDRKDLDDQTIDEYNSFEPDCVDNTTDTKALVTAIQKTDTKLIVTTIQKMAAALRLPQYAPVMDTCKDKRCVFIIDECHRSQFGKMHTDIVKHFQNAVFIGFTGTPIFRENKSADGRTTADLFATGTDKLDPCIHRYMIKEAIADGNVLRFSVEYLRSVYAQKTSDPNVDLTQIDDPDYCKAHGIDITDLYHVKERIEAVADSILSQLEQHTRPEGKDVYTAIFAADSIPILMQYYDYMQAHNPNGYKIAAIFTYKPNEDTDDGATALSSSELERCMKDYNAMFGTDFDLDKFDSYRKDISKRMKQKDEPQIDLLLVVNMFLTGFDSVPTNSLFLDKTLVWHSLVQAYSRTNRVGKPTKQFGQIITYRNIKRAQDAALKLFSGDGNPNDFLMQNYDFYVAAYQQQVEILRKVAPTADDAGYLVNEEDIKAFIYAFRNIAHTLAVIKTFSRFDWADLDVFLDEEEYSDYKSWYLSFFDEQEHRRKAGQTTSLDDVDFTIELVRTDKINVVYILNLLKDAAKTDPEKKKEAVDLILREIERSDNEKLRYKKEILKAFIVDRFFEISPDADITAEYEAYEREVMLASVSEFSEANELDSSLVMDVLSEYMCDPKRVSKEYIRKLIADMHLGLLKTTKLTEELLQFVQEAYNKFTTEGD